MASVLCLGKEVTGMTEALLVRSGEQKGFIEMLAHEVHAAAPDEAAAYEIYVAQFLMAAIRYIVSSNGTDLAVSPTAAALQFAAMVPRIEGFCRIESERPELARQLFEKLWPAIANRIEQSYGMDRTTRPRQALHAPSTMFEM